MAPRPRYPGLNRQRLLAFSLARSLHERQWARDRGTEELDDWFREYLALNRGLGAAAIDAETWRRGLDRLFGRLRLADLLERIDFDVISRHMRQVGRFGRGELFHLALRDGEVPRWHETTEPDRVTISKIVYVRKGCSVPPHGHSNMVSAFLHLSDQCCDEVEAGKDNLARQPRCDTMGIHRPGGSVAKVLLSRKASQRKAFGRFFLSPQVSQMQDAG